MEQPAPPAGEPQPEAAGSFRRGAWYGFSAYALWGLMPVYFVLLAPSGPWEIIAHRIVWTLLLCVVALLVTRRARGLAALVRRPRDAAGIAAAGVLIASNWLIYVTAVTTGHVTDAALGYFLNPLISVALGLFVLRERLSRGQTVAVAVGACGGLYLTLASGGVPWIAVSLAVTFGLYGLLKNLLGARLTAVEGLTAETAVLAPVAVVGLIVLAVRGESTFTAAGPGHATLLILAGVVTAVPLLLFAAAARRVTLVTIGLLQFIVPIMQFLIGLAFGEQMSTQRWVGFGIVWVACVLLVLDTIRTVRRARTGRGPAQDAADRPVPSSRDRHGHRVRGRRSRSPAAQRPGTGSSSTDRPRWLG